jgi:hypothetical protein
MTGKKVRITKYASDICWWQGCLGQESEVFEIEPTEYIKIKVNKTDPRVIEYPTYEIEGWIPLECVEVIE